jgi:hypothetical protein
MVSSGQLANAVDSLAQHGKTGNHRDWSQHGRPRCP